MARTKSKRTKIRYNFYIYEDQLKVLEQMGQLDDIATASRLRTWIDDKLAEHNKKHIEVQEPDSGFNII
jgi:hypothetical protein